MNHLFMFASYPRSTFVPQGDPLEHLPIVFTQSNVYAGTSAADTTNMRDANGDGDPTTATGTDTGTAWIKADLGEPKQVFKIVLGGGSIPSFTDIFPTYALGSGFMLQYSTDDSSWTSVRDTVPQFAWSNEPDEDRDLAFIFAPVTARYWRIYRTSYIALATFRFYALDVEVEKVTPVTYTQSSSYGSSFIATEARLNDDPHSQATGAATNSGLGQYIQMDVGSEVRCRLVAVGGGDMSGWGTTSSYVKDTRLEYSSNGVDWTSAGTPFTAMNDGPYLFIAEIDITARYFRIVTAVSNWLATTAFRIYKQQP